MEQEQRKIVELRMIDMIKLWNEMYRKPSNRTNMKLQFGIKKTNKPKSKPRSSIKFSRESIPKMSEVTYYPMKMMEFPRKKAFKIKKHI